MELGHYGWNRKVDIFQQHAVFLDRPAPATSYYGVLNIGDGPFDGRSGGFSGSVNGTFLAINSPFNYTGSFIDCRLAGANRFLIDSNANIFMFGDPYALTSFGVVNIGTQFFSGAGQFAGSANGTYLAINALSGFTGNLIDCQIAGSSIFKVDNVGSAITRGVFWSFGAANLDSTYSTLMIGPSFFSGAGQFAGSASGTALGISYASGYAGNFADWQVNGVSKFAVSASGDVTANTVRPAKLTGLSAVEAALEFT
jgi:hypothetical protein